MVHVQFFTLLRLLLNIDALDVAWKREDTVLSILQKTAAMIDKEFLSKLLDEQGKLRVGTIILVNGINIFHLQKLDTKISENDCIALFPPGGGG